MYLSNIFHDKTHSFNLHKGFYTPAATIASSKDAQWILCAFLYNPIETVRSTLTPWVTFVDGSARFDFNLLVLIISQNNSCLNRTTLSIGAVCTWTSEGSFIVYGDSWSWPVFVNVVKVYGWALQVNSIFNKYHPFVVLSSVEVILPSLQSYSLLGFLYNVLSNRRWQGAPAVFWSDCLPFLYPR